MDDNQKFMQVGHFIYGFQRVRMTLAGLYQMLDGSGHNDLQLAELASRTAALFARRRAADAVAVSGFNAVIESVQKHGARLDKLLAQIDPDNVPDEDELQGLLNCQHELERFQRLLASAPGDIAGS
ncbi:hypothetical protein ACFSQU_13060 [Massilia sp. GCM10020059]|uniref:Uncharacterized protein n=1 Tax=Massilia agrisoli TaxID=2892444 RepID=A0ABS8IYB9_9BURK|nr:hypothetical protein [Massilia agrisoli]MCC6072688.1 hypothetical protein [Massilia agrisoli]